MAYEHGVSMGHGGKKRREKLYEKMGYTNDNNPFGDSDLGRKFSWKKKESAEQPSSSKKKNRDRQADEEYFVQEISKVRKRRSERKAELAEMERLREEESRLRNAEACADWQSKEEEFLLAQTKVRSVLRLAAGRGKPIDNVAKGVLMVEHAEGKKDSGSSFREGDMELHVSSDDVRDPRDIIEGLDPSGLSEVLEGARSYAEVERRRGGEWLEFWTSFAMVCEYRLHADERAVHGAVVVDLSKAFMGKSRQELEQTAHDIENRIAAAASDDASKAYWERVGRECAYAKANAVLEESFSDLQRRQRAILSSYHHKNEATARGGPNDKKAVPQNANPSSAEVAMEEHERDRGCNEDEELFSSEVPVKDPPKWHAEARFVPRKPRYVNRIKTGYEWNKYNQTHYSQEEPPPKVVQGYKFNIFYPDLIEPAKPPNYHLQPCAGDPDFCILLFVSPGPPYADIAFKIVNQEWERSQRRGFRCVFERGVLQLHFNFKRWRYRR